MTSRFLLAVLLVAAVAAATGCKKRRSHAPPPPAAAPPVVNAVIPPSGSTAGGALVTVYGESLANAAAVRFGGVDGSNVATQSAGQVSANTPAASAGTVDVVVQRIDGAVATLSTAYTYVSGASTPAIASLSPTKGPANGGNSVTITGSGFATSGTVQVWFGAIAATSVAVQSASTVVATAPAGTAGAQVNVALANPDGGSATHVAAYRYVGAPLVTAISPALGLAAGGDTVTITGQGFVAGTTATLGGVAVTGATITATQIVATTGAHAAGIVDLIVTNPDTNWDQLVGGFLYTATPSLTAVNPSEVSYLGGATITLTGSDFVAGATVDLQGTAATGVTVVSATEIRCTVPAMAPAELDVTVTNPGGYSATLTDALYVVYPNGHQRAQFTWDTSTGIDYRRRWLIETNWAAFRSDLAAKGLQSGTASDPVNEYAVDWLTAYIGQGVNIHYGRNGDGSKNSGSSVNVTFVVVPPATGSPGGGGATGYSRMCIGGTSSSGGGVLGTAMFDGGNPLCGDSSENDCLGPQFGGSGGTLGVFTASISAPGSALSPALSQADQKYLDGSVTTGSRYTAIHGFMLGWAYRIAYVTSHEIGHSCGLAADRIAAGSGSCGTAGQCSATSAHNNCCTTNIMRSSVTYSGITGFASRAFSGQPGSVSAASTCYTGALSSWAMLTSFLGVSP